MNEKLPPRRWYQFKLSTILVLVGIAAWAMALRPYWTVRDETSRWAEQLVKNGEDSRPLGLNDADPYSQPKRFDAGLRWRLSKTLSRLQWPILILAVFLTWKTAWAIASRRESARTHTQVATHSTPPPRQPFLARLR